MTTLLSAGAFVGASLKVDRANHHIDDLRAIIAEIEREKLYSPAVSQNSNAWVLNFGDLGPRAQMIPLVIGDTLHNLRSAFDHLWVALTLAANPPERQTLAAVRFAKFPFQETKSSVEREVEMSPVVEAFPSIRSLILDTIKPYSGADGNHLLWAITKLNKIDKHNLLVPIIRVNHVKEMVVKTSGSTFHFTNCNIESTGDFFVSDSQIEMKPNHLTKVELTFPIEYVIGGEPVITTLSAMSQFTSDAVRNFKETFLVN